MRFATGRSVFGVRWVEIPLLEVGVAPWFLAIAIGPAAACLWIFVGRDPAIIGSPWRPRILWVRS